MGLFNWKSTTDNSSAAIFWRWFELNRDRLAEADARSERLFDELQAELGKVHQGLTFESGAGKRSPREFIVSADGVRSRFSAVEALVEAAPKIEGWRVIAFRPRMGTHMIIEMAGRRLGPQDLWFAASREGPLVSLHLFVRGLTPENRKQFSGAVFVLLDAAIGEFDVECKIGGISIEPLPPDPETSGLRPFDDLPAAVDELSGSVG